MYSYMVSSLGFRVQDVHFRFWGHVLRARRKGSVLRALVLGCKFKVYCSGNRAQGMEGEGLSEGFRITEGWVGKGISCLRVGGSGAVDAGCTAQECRCTVIIMPRGFQWRCVDVRADSTCLGHKGVSPSDRS
jgi:hypothetical protein